MDKYSDAWRNVCRIVCDFTSTPHFKKTLFWGVALYLIALFALLRLFCNLSWGMRFTRRFPPCFVNGPQVLFPSKGKIAVQSHTAITSIVDSASQNQLRIKCESL